jgi:hypothetical protein
MGEMNVKKREGTIIFSVDGKEIKLLGGAVGMTGLIRLLNA